MTNYRILNRDEIVQQGDQFYVDANGWYDADTTVGLTLDQLEVKFPSAPDHPWTFRRSVLITPLSYSQHDPIDRLNEILDRYDHD